MNPLLLLLGLKALGDSSPSSSRATTTRRTRSAHKWPTPRHAPALKMPSLPPMPHEAPDDHATPADHAQGGDEAPPAPEQHDSAGTDATDHGEHLSDLHAHPHEPAHAAQHVEQHARPQHTVRDYAPNTPVRRVRARPAPRPRPAPGDSGDRTVASLQRVLVALGWTGRLTTKGAVQPSLKDGLCGPVTFDDWAQSARKRGLDPTIVRMAPNVARVNPATFAALSRAGGGVSGLRLP